jgi:2-polyprenyl-3-methyl-5-hydroxy-6-metoxy-1,4-benzoquinol methylase
MNMMPEHEVPADPSNGWEAVAAQLVARRSSIIGVATVRSWSEALPPGASVLDLGCGSGVPISEALTNDGFVVWGIDASPTLVAAFQRSFPDAPVACEAVEVSDFFGRSFDAIVAIGLMFLLPPEAQRSVIRHVASALKPEGRFLFTAPTQTGTWADSLTGRPSVSLGDEAYRLALADAGLSVVAEYGDEGENHYYDAGRRRFAPR